MDTSAHRRAFSWLLVASVLFAGFVMGTEPATGAFPGANGQIVFTGRPYTCCHYRELYAVNPDGSGRRVIDLSYSYRFTPAVSPDGSKIVFHHYQALGNSSIHVINVDGSGETHLTPGQPSTSNSTLPHWSPDGSKVVFTRAPEGTWNYIYVMNADGSGVRRLSELDGSQPAWSPDGTRIAFVRWDGTSYQVWLMNADGSATRSLGALGLHPDWSPDGTRITFTSGRDGNDEIYVMNADGTGQRRLTSRDAFGDRQPAFSPDGRYIVFSSEDRSLGDRNNTSLFMMNADGTALRQLTEPTLDDSEPSWAPGGAGTPTPTPMPTPMPTPIPTPAPVTTLYLHNNPSPPTGDTSAQKNLAMNTTGPSATTLYRYSTDYYSAFPGRYLEKKTPSATQSNTQYMANWTYQVTQARALSGTAVANLWITMKDHKCDKTPSVTVYLRSKTSATTDSGTLLGSATGSSAPPAGSGTCDFRAMNVSVPVKSTLAAGSWLELKVVVNLSTGDAALLAYDTTTYASRLVLP